MKTKNRSLNAVHWSNTLINLVGVSASVVTMYAYIKANNLDAYLIEDINKCKKAGVNFYHKVKTKVKKTSKDDIPNNNTIN